MSLLDWMCDGLLGVKLVVPNEARDSTEKKCFNSSRRCGVELDEIPEGNGITSKIGENLGYDKDRGGNFRERLFFRNGNYIGYVVEYAGRGSNK
ncbi:hypothetical protein HOD75_00985 [archaeon]|nr:hypothetical protein [archaeon]MBT4241452.1 hypothetical protein [archaeon]MBT4417677.1 hypothetical protein [archaeon]